MAMSRLVPLLEFNPMVQARTPYREPAEDGADRERVITLAATRLAALRTSPLWQQ